MATIYWWEISTPTELFAQEFHSLYSLRCRKEAPLYFPKHYIAPLSPITIEDMLENFDFYRSMKPIEESYFTLEYEASGFEKEKIGYFFEAEDEKGVFHTCWAQFFIYNMVKLGYIYERKFNYPTRLFVRGCDCNIQLLRKWVNEIISNT